MKKICFVLVVFFSCQAYAFEKFEPVCHYITNKAVTVYSKPDTESPVIMEIAPGGEIALGQYVKGLGADRGIWCEIYYGEDNALQTGYMQNPGRPNDRIRYGDVRFTYDSVRHDVDEGEVVFSAIINGEVKAVYTISEVYGMYDYPRFTAISGEGLQNVELILSLYFAPDFCAPIYEYFVAWDGSRFLALPYSYNDSMPDNDWYSEHLIFPADGAPFNTIIKTVYTATKFDIFDTPLDIEYATQVYRWDGEKAMPIEQNMSIIMESAD